MEICRFDSNVSEDVEFLTKTSMPFKNGVLIKNKGHATEANEVKKFSSQVTGLCYSKLSSSLGETTLDMHMKCICAEKYF